MKKIKVLIPFILLSVVTFFSLGKTLSYYFFTDDYAFLYYLGHNLDFGWPYTYVLPLFRPIYLLFGTDPFPYLLLAIVTYFLAGIAVYFTAKQLTKSRLVATLSSLIFATGYIGLEQFSLIAVSTINNINVINVCITLIVWIKFVRTKKIIYYFLAFLMFGISMTLFPYRAYPLILFLPTIDFFMNFQFDNPKKIISRAVLTIARIIPFFLFSSIYGVFSYGPYGEGNESGFFNIITNSENNIFTLINIEFLQELFGVLGKFVLVKPIVALLNVAPNLNLYASVGFILFFITVLISLILILKKKNDGRNLLIVLFLTIEAYVGNMILHVDFAGNGAVNRYLTIAFLPFSILVVLLLFVIASKPEKFKLFNKRIAIIITVLLIVLSYSLLSREYEREVIKERSNPAKSFFIELKNYLPQVSNSSYNVFYFDRASYYPISTRFGNVLLSAAMSNSVNLAVPYGIDKESIKIVDTFDQFLRFVIYPPEGKTIKYYTFYNNEKGLHETTKQVFALLKNGSYTKIPNDQIHYTKNKEYSSIDIETKEISSLTPLNVKISLKATPRDYSSFSFPYLGTADESIKDFYEKNNFQKTEIYKYLLSREKYYQTVSVDVESIHIGKQNPASYLIDEKNETIWLSDQSRWEVNIKPWIKIGLSENRNVGRIIWQELPTRLIEKFTISTSIDGKSWNKVDNVAKKNIPSDETLKIVDFDSVEARYVLINIDELSYGSPGPGLAEIEVVEDEFKNINLESALRISNSPFEYIKDSKELSEAYDYLRQNAKLLVKSQTNRDDPNSNFLLFELPIFLDGKLHEYEFELPPGGTELKTVSLEANFPASFTVENIDIENIPLVILKEEIKKKCDLYANVPQWQNPFDCKYE